MTRARPALSAPELAGFSYLQHLGSGGYAEVFLYEQTRTGLKVAVKVLNADSLDGAVQRQFTAEANTMARLSNHPFIVPVMGADITADGRPYIVMTYYSKPNLSVRARREPFSVPDVLRIGIQVSSAVETAHQAGILHRDIKPANILTAEYGAPGLTDFGIAVATTAEVTTTAEGMSVPWSPPEVLFGQSDGDVRSDVYSLGATLWHLLAGRSPYEEPDGDNSHVALMRRVQRDPVRPVQRHDVPEGLQRLLRQALAKSPDGRPQSALALARGLQAVEQDLRLPRTEIVVPQSAGLEAEARSEAEGSATVVRAARIVRAQPSTSPAAHSPADVSPQPVRRSRPPSRLDEVAELPTTGRAAVIGVPAGLAPSTAPVPARAPSRAVGPRRRAPLPVAPEPGPTVQRAAAPASVRPDHAETSDGPPRPRRLVAAAAVLVVAVGGAGIGLAVTHLGGGAEAKPATPAADPQDALDPARGLAPGAPKVTAQTVSPGRVRFAFTYSDGLPGDTFRWTRTGSEAPAGGAVTTSTVELPAPVCITVRAVRTSGLASAPSDPTCAP